MFNKSLLKNILLYGVIAGLLTLTYCFVLANFGGVQKSFVPIQYKQSGYFASEIVNILNDFFQYYVDNLYNISFVGSSIQIKNYDSSNLQCTLILKITVGFTNKDFDLRLTDTLNNWSNYFGYTNASYNLSNSPVIGTVPFINNLLLLTDINNQFTIEPLVDSNGGVYTKENLNKIIIKLNLPTNVLYTREDIISEINYILFNNPVTTGSYISDSLGKTIIRLNINKTFTTQDYRIVFFDNTFTRCNFGKSSIDNVKWDTTIGWVLGYRNQTEYGLQKSNQNGNGTSTYYTDYPTQSFSVNSDTNIVLLTSDTSININLYNYLLVVLNDYCQNHLNDGLVTVTKTDYDIPLPSYANRTTYQCDASGQLSIVNGNLTSKQLYSANQILNTKQVNQKQNVYSSGPFTQDIFALIPVKTAGLSPGQSFIDFSGTLQNQERTYFGPVNIRKITIQLLNDKGSTLDLNGANWSFSFIAEQLYNPSRN